MILAFLKPKYDILIFTLFSSKNEIFAESQGSLDQNCFWMCKTSASVGLPVGKRLLKT